MKTLVKIICAALPIAAVLVAFSAVGAFAGTGDMGVLAAVQTPSTQAQNANLFLGLIACAIGLLGAAIMYFMSDHNMQRAAITFLVVTLGVVMIKNIPAWIAAIPGTGALY